MKKSLILLAVAGISLSMSAQRASDVAFDAGLYRDYNRLGISYNNEHYGFNNDAADDWDIDGVGLNGFGIDYIHGFHITDAPLFLETGLNFNFNFGSTTEKGSNWKETTKLQDMNFQIPVNLGYRFAIGEDMSLQPYVGLNFKVHMSTRVKWEEVEGNYSDETDWINVFSDDKEDMGYDDETWNRFQMGWHVGVGLNINPVYIGVQYGTDFLSAYSHDYGSFKPKISTGNLKVSVAYMF